MGLGGYQLKCRVPATILLNPVHTEHSWVTIEMHHASGCLNVLKNLGLCHKESTTERFIPLDHRFVNKRHYPCAMPGEGIISLTNGRIFAYTLSQSNVQQMTAYFSSRYLAKYVDGDIDEGNVIYVAPGNDYAGGKQNITLELVLQSNFYHASNPLPMIMFSHIKPSTHLLNFLLHVALSLGEFLNELELFGDSTDICNIFDAGRLYDPTDPVGSTKHPICQYVLEQLVHLPGVSVDDYELHVYRFGSFC
jgi:hypothetical protein